MKIWTKAVIVFIIALGVRLYGINAAGNVWDEYFYYDAMRSYTRNLVNRDFNSDHWQANLEHPPIGKYVYLPALVFNKWQKVSDRDAYRAPRVISAIIGAATVLVVFLIGARFFSKRVGLMAALIYGLLPPVLAYHKIINLDVTMVFLFTLTMYFLFAKKWWLVVILASLAIATKFNAALIIPIIVALPILKQWRPVIRSGEVSLPIPVVILPLIASLILWAVWPWLWSGGLDHFLQTLDHWGGTVKENYFGKFGAGPLSYFVGHFLVGTPALIIALVLLGSIKIILSKKVIAWILLLWLVMPFAISFYHLRQDHLRYVLTAFPAASLVASLGFWAITDRFARQYSLAKLLSVAVVIVYLVITAWRIHPYYLNYYNELIGGTKTVAARNWFDLGFYGEGIKEATDFVNRTSSDGSTVHYEIIPDDAPYLDRPRLTRFDKPGADYLIFNTNAVNDDKKRLAIDTSGYQKIYAVKAAGAEFVWVYKIQK